MSKCKRKLTNARDLCAIIFGVISNHVKKHAPKKGADRCWGLGSRIIFGLINFQAKKRSTKRELTGNPSIRHASIRPVRPETQVDPPRDDPPGPIRAFTLAQLS